MWFVYYYDTYCFWKETKKNIEISLPLTLVWQFSRTSFTSRSRSSLWYWTFSSISANACLRFSISFWKQKLNANDAHETSNKTTSAFETKRFHSLPDAVRLNHWPVLPTVQHDTVHFLVHAIHLEILFERSMKKKHDEEQKFNLFDTIISTGHKQTNLKSINSFFQFNTVFLSLLQFG